MLNGIEIERKMQLPAPALLGPGPVPLIGDIVLKRGQKKRAELASLTVGLADHAFLKQTKKEPLDKILGLLNAVTATADEKIQWLPVDLAERLERPARRDR